MSSSTDGVRKSAIEHTGFGASVNTGIGAFSVEERTPATFSSKNACIFSAVMLGDDQVLIPYAEIRNPGIRSGNAFLDS